MAKVGLDAAADGDADAEDDDDDDNDDDRPCLCDGNLAKSFLRVLSNCAS